MADRFHVNSPLGVGPVELDGPEAHHLATVCRLRPGDVVCLFNGDGREYPAEVTQVAKRVVSLNVLRVEAPERELAFRLEVAAPVPKGDRAQFLVEKLTELGVTTFVPLKTARSVVEPREAKREKLERYVIEASKQCGRNVLMQIEPLAEWASYCCRDTLPPRRLLAHPGGAGRLGVGGEVDAALAVGPEGGFTDEEVGAARSAGWQVIGLGPRILRIETAAVVLAGRLSVNGYP
ncbi:MAG: 16S rRNA (uracil(1498)-N(3))-methyltransferase [Planctomycetes bacterium]|nr:16S rRNA (uracil(1498)-N(3))-methyltransferase [Planctomycetota bacterium]